MTDSNTLLSQYARTGSESAFRELVSRYIDLVYSTAFRLVDGDVESAQDVAQTVFVALADQARTLPKDVMLGGWLHLRTRFAAGKLMRTERRRQLRERQAAEMNAIEDHSESNLAQVAPVLDEAIGQLDAEDRTAILLRFFERKDFRSVGDALGSSEEAARKRVDRALEKLHVLLKHRGAALTAAALGTLLAAEAVTAAPAGLAGSVTAAALASVAAGAGITGTLVRLMTIAKVKLGIISAFAVAGVALPLAIQNQSQARLRAENQALRQEASQLAQAAAENEHLSNLVVQANGAASLSREQMSELLRLRGEVGVLRRRLAEAPKAGERITQGPQPQPQSDTQQERQMAMARRNYTRFWMMAFIVYADQNQGQCPTSFDQAATFLPDPGKNETNVAPDEFEIVYRGSLTDLTNASNIIVIRQKEAWQSVVDGGWLRAYGFADGHSELHQATDGNFGPWEDQHR
jgi:RNA polymerase sigma factor (sigma-70 family)